VSSIPFYESVLSSLFSKLLNDATLSARGQSIMLTSKSLASIMGPLASGFVFPKGVIYVEMMMGVLWFSVYLLLVIAWKSMDVENLPSDVPKSDAKVERKANDTDNSTDGEVHWQRGSPVGKRFSFTMAMGEGEFTLDLGTDTDKGESSYSHADLEDDEEEELETENLKLMTPTKNSSHINMYT